MWMIYDAPKDDALYFSKHSICDKVVSFLHQIFQNQSCEENLSPNILENVVFAFSILNFTEWWYIQGHPKFGITLFSVFPNAN